MVIILNNMYNALLNGLGVDKHFILTLHSRYMDAVFVDITQKVWIVNCVWTFIMICLGDQQKVVVVMLVKVSSQIINYCFS